MRCSMEVELVDGEFVFLPSNEFEATGVQTVIDTFVNDLPFPESEKVRKLLVVEREKIASNRFD